ncbi:tetratricopeptide repeat protein, partial [Actinosynnema sp. NPDC059797]
ELERAVDAVGEAWSAARPHLSELSGEAVEGLLLARSAAVNHLTSLTLHRRAVALGEDVLADVLALLGPAHHVTVAARANLGGALLGVGRADRAVALFAENAACPAGDDREALGRRRNLALAHHAAGRGAVALKLLRDSLREGERLLGPDDPDLIGTRYWLARCLADAGRVAEAVGHLERAREHPGTTFAVTRELEEVRSLLITLYRRSGRVQDALLENWS